MLREVARVLKPSGAVWLNLGDSYSTHTRYGAPPKGLLLAPERLVLALARDGWIVRNKVVWAKPNAAPSSVRDRLNATHEPIYFLVRRRRYHFNLDAVRVPYRSPQPTRRPRHVSTHSIGTLAQPRLGLLQPRHRHPLGKNPGDVWTIPPKPYRGDGHPATFPPALVERPLLATSPRWTCAICGVPRLLDRPACGCPTDERVPGLVLDPFIGTGTVALIARQHGRDWLGIELNPAYAQLARRRLDEAAALEPAMTGSAAPRCCAAALSDPSRIAGRTNSEEAHVMKTLAIRLDDDLHAQLVILAQLYGTTITDEIRDALEQHIERRRSESDLTDRAQSVLDEIEREAVAKRDAIKALFGNGPDAPAKEAPNRRKKSTGDAS